MATASNHDVTPVGLLYARFTPVYDLVFGPVLQPGRRAAVGAMALRGGERVLEVGVGTGINAALYPPSCRVVGIDLSEGMLAAAEARIARERLTHVRVQRMDGAALAFADGSFDVVYAPYTISAAPDPIRIVAEMRRVCRAGGRIVLLNHFLSSSRVLAGIEHRLTWLTRRIGFRADLGLQSLLDQTGLRAVSVRRVNVPPIWSLVLCAP
ncbi:MAG: methyltransferase domain-containing protein [Acidobacteria bacterium]|nr:methyltransferase domain-containing protein [Acidobacteriota bacterium]